MSLKEQPKGAPEHLEEETGRPQSEFEASVSDDEMPELEALEWEPIDDEASPFSDC